MSEENQEDSKKGLIYLGAGMIVLIIAVFLLVKFAPALFASKPQTLQYNGFEFKYDGTFWNTEWQNGLNKYALPLRYNPKEAESVQVFGKLDDSFNNRSNIYITIDPTNKASLKWVGLAKGELIWSLIGPIQKKVNDSCTVNSTECTGFPIVDCTDTNKSVIYLVPNETAKILASGTCVVIEGSEFELVKAVDRFLYSWYGIMK